MLFWVPFLIGISLLFNLALHRKFGLRAAFATVMVLLVFSIGLVAYALIIMPMQSLSHRYYFSHEFASIFSYLGGLFVFGAAAGLALGELGRRKKSVTSSIDQS